MTGTKDQLQLSAELFEEILNHLRGPHDPGDKRDFPRVGVRNRVTIQPVGNPDDKTPLPGRVRDLSPHGIGMLTERPMMRDSQFAIRLPVAGGPEVTAIYKVAHCAQVGQGMYAIGAQLEKVQNGARRPASKSSRR